VRRHRAIEHAKSKIPVVALHGIDVCEMRRAPVVVHEL
jgi:hypothetical protein